MNNRPMAKALMPLVLAAAVLAGFTAESIAQTGSSARRVEKLEPPTPGQAKTDGIVWPMLMGMLLAGAALTVNLIPSKRGHQD
jgi:hypothetical protein